MNYPAQCVVFCLFLSACGTDEAIFGTTTSIGLNAEAAPASISISYDRHEEFVGPADQNGDMPPAVARITSNHSVLNPKVSQLYATGEAALDVTVTDAQLAKRTVPQTVAVEGERRVAFFGVSQTVGLKVALNPSTVVDSVVFGYRRKEASYLPLVKGPDGRFVYPSTLAAIAVNTQIKGLNDTEQGVGQFFATGAAARNLAMRHEVRKLIGGTAASALAQSAEGLA